jgi:CRISPR-associated protein Cmr5
MRAVERLIPAAIAAITASKMEEEDNKGSVNKAYKGYISAFGAGIIQSGLLPTLAMYKGNEDSDRKKANTGKLLDAIYRVVKSKHDPKPEEINLFDYALTKMKKAENQQGVISEIMNASIAVKLAIRTFKMIES